MDFANLVAVTVLVVGFNQIQKRLHHLEPLYNMVNLLKVIELYTENG